MVMKIFIEDDVEDTTVQAYEPYEVDDAVENSGGYESICCFLSQSLFLAPKQSSVEDWRHRSIFSTTCHIHDFSAKLIIDPTASENFVAEKDANKQKLKTEEHPQSYRLAWLDNHNTVNKKMSCSFCDGKF